MMVPSAPCSSHSPRVLISCGLCLAGAQVEGTIISVALCRRCILVHLVCSLHFGLDLIMELTRH
jgi:hypothetical protein